MTSLAHLHSETTSGRQNINDSGRKRPLPLVLYILAMFIPVHFYLGPLYLTGVRMILIIMAIPLFINLLQGKYGKIIIADILFALHLFFQSLSLLINNPESLISQLGSTGVEFYVGYLFGRAYIRNIHDHVAVIKLLAVLVSLTIPFAVAESLTGDPYVIQTIRKIPFFTSEPINYYGTRLGLYRCQVILSHPIHYGLLCSSVFPLIFLGLKGSISNTSRYIWSLLCLSGVFFSLSSGAILPVVLLVILMSWHYSLFRVKGKWILFVSILTILYIVVDLGSTRRPIDVFTSYATFSSDTAYWRKFIFQWGMVNVWQNPFIGLGLNDWVRPDWMLFVASVDNFWLLNAMRYGIPGFLSLLLPVLISVFAVGRGGADDGAVAKNIRLAWVFCMISFSVSLTTVHIWATLYSFFFFLFGSGMWMLHKTDTPYPETDQDQAPKSPTRGPGEVTYSRFAPRERNGAGS